MKIDKTDRGFNITLFNDDNGNRCSLQESSSADESKIWLGVSPHRMHLTRGQVKELLPHLKKFVKTGEL